MATAILFSKTIPEGNSLFIILQNKQSICEFLISNPVKERDLFVCLSGRHTNSLIVFSRDYKIKYDYRRTAKINFNRLSRQISCHGFSSWLFVPLSLVLFVRACSAGKNWKTSYNFRKRIF